MLSVGLAVKVVIMAPPVPVGLVVKTASVWPSSPQVSTAGCADVDEFLPDAGKRLEL